MEQEVQTLQGDMDTLVQDEAATLESPESTSVGVDDSPQPDGEATETGTAPASEQKDTGAAFAAVKKASRSKGREEGFRAGYEQAQRELSAQAQGQATDPNSQAYGQQPAGQTPPQYAQGGQQMAADPQVAAFYQQQQQVGQAGLSKYKGEWVDKLQQLSHEVQFNPDLQQAVLIAQGLPNAEDIIYKLASDESAREQILEKNPKRWTQELLTLAVPEQKAPQTKVVKVANPPVEPLKAPPGNGGGKKTMAQKIMEKKARRVRGLA